MQWCCDPAQKIGKNLDKVTIKNHERKQMALVGCSGNERSCLSLSILKLFYPEKRARNSLNVSASAKHRCLRRQSPALASQYLASGPQYPPSGPHWDPNIPHWVPNIPHWVPNIPHWVPNIHPSEGVRQQRTGVHGSCGVVCPSRAFAHRGRPPGAEERRGRPQSCQAASQLEVPLVEQCWSENETCIHRHAAFSAGFQEGAVGGGLAPEKNFLGPDGFTLDFLILSWTKFVL